MPDAIHDGDAGGPEPAALLALWACGLAHDAVRRGDALLRALPDDGDGDGGADAPAATLGERNARLLGWHARWFGSRLELLSHCPACGSAAQFDSDCATLAAVAADRPPGPAAQATHHLATGGHEITFRLPTGDDVARAADVDRNADGDADRFALRLLERCVVDCRSDGAPAAVAALPAPVVDALAERMEALDPAAAIDFALHCPRCGTAWTAPLDVGELLWGRLQRDAERLLLEVDTLARAYGWSEAEVLRLPPLRRAAYLQLAREPAVA